MREILFRGQTRRCGERVWMNGEKVPSNWVYGGIFPGTGDFSVIYGANKEDFTGADIAKHTVYSDSVGQFTGLTDASGVRIFEGDIVDILSECEELGVIAYEDGAFIVNASGFSLDFISNIDGEDVEVIGNIHDNPELLEGERKDNGTA